jgi:hypothetical protein
MRAALLALSLLALPLFAEEGKVTAGGTFDRVILDGAVEVQLKQGDRDDVTVAPDSESQEVEVRIRGGRLIVHDTGSWRFWNKSRPKVDIQVRNLRELIISGASDVYAAGPFKSEALTLHMSGTGLVRFDALDAEQLRFIISGAGDGQLAGKVGDMRLTVSGKGKVQADQLRAANAIVQISGVGNAQLWVTDTLRIGISGVGTVDYWGQPQVSRSSSGLATVNARGDKR